MNVWISPKKFLEESYWKDLCFVNCIYEGRGLQSPYQPMIVKNQAIQQEVSGGYNKCSVLESTQ